MKFTKLEILLSAAILTFTTTVVVPPVFFNHKPLLPGPVNEVLEEALNAKFNRRYRIIQGIRN